MSNSLRPHGLYSPWNSPGQNSGVGSLFLLQGIFPTQVLNPGLSHWASLVAQLVKNLPEMQETPVQFLGWEDPLEKEKATHCSILAWRIPWLCKSMGSQRVRHNWATFTARASAGPRLKCQIQSVAPLTEKCVWQFKELSFIRRL